MDISDAFICAIWHQTTTARTILLAYIISQCCHLFLCSFVNTTLRHVFCCFVGTIIATVGKNWNVGNLINVWCDQVHSLFLVNGMTVNLSINVISEIVWVIHKKQHRIPHKHLPGAQFKVSLIWRCVWQTTLIFLRRFKPKHSTLHNYLGGGAKCASASSDFLALCKPIMCCWHRNCDIATRFTRIIMRQHLRLIKLRKIKSLPVSLRIRKRNRYLLEHIFIEL